MKNGKVRKIVILIIVACMILTVLGCVAWKKRIGIYNTYMKMTGREPSRTTQWVLKGKEIGYHKQVIKTGKNKRNFKDCGQWKQYGESGIHYYAGGFLGGYVFRS